MPSGDQKDTTQDFAERLEAVKKKRGYLMPHHGLLALTAPELLAGYDACYSALTLTKRELPPRDREFIWLGILAAREEYLATQHVSKFIDAGGTHKEIIAASQLAAIARGIGSIRFASEYWSGHVPEFSHSSYYLGTLQKFIDGTSVKPPLLHLMMCAVHTSLQNWQELRLHISWLYDANIPESQLAEALSYSMFTGSIPFFIEGCEVWRSMIENKEVRATEPFVLWATTDQSGPK